ncbi:MAG TPA: head-tail adaptor protein [Ktedonobacterales bacterium]|nr:head-tail adaptor protein [Ktedonobacterales bacterium]
MIPASELAAMRATASSALDISGVQIQRKSVTDNGNGTQSITWSTIATVAATEAKPTASVMQQYSGVIGSATVWTLRLPYGTSYHADDRILMPSGETRRISADLSDSSYSTCALLLVARIQPGG